MKISVIGAGPAGLIAAKAFLEAGHCVTIYDKQQPGRRSKSHPFFIHRDIGAELGIQLQKVRAQEVVACEAPESDWANLWSLNTTGIITENRMWSVERRSVKNFYVSDNLLDDLRGMLKGSVSLLYEDVHRDRFNKIVEESDYTISTIPLDITCGWMGMVVPKLEYSPMRLFRWDLTEDPKFNKVTQIYYDPSAKNGWVRFCNDRGFITAELTCDEKIEIGKLPAGYDEEMVPYRSKFVLSRPKLRYIPIGERARKSIITELTNRYRIMSIGRFATWSYKRVDHLPEDARKLVEIVEIKGARQ